MKFYKEGEKSRAICSDCKKQVATTFMARTVPLSSGKAEVPDVLVAVCDECDRVVSIPQQSAPKVAEVLSKKKKSVEARVPYHVRDMMLQTLIKIDAEPKEESLRILISHFILRAEKDRLFNKKTVRVFLASEFLNAANSDRISLRLNSPISEIFDNLTHRLDVGPTDLVKALAVFMQIELLEKSNKKEIASLKEQIIIAS